MVYLAMGDVVDGHFKGGVLNGTLENGGVGLAPFHGLESRVPISLPAKLDEIKRGIAEGSISVDQRATSEPMSPFRVARAEAVGFGLGGLEAKANVAVVTPRQRNRSPSTQLQAT